MTEERKRREESPARKKAKALARFGRAHAQIEKATDARLDAALEARAHGATWPEIAASSTERPITPEGVKMLVSRGVKAKEQA